MAIPRGPRPPQGVSPLLNLAERRQREAEELRARLAEAVALLRRLTDYEDGPCAPDHHDFCQSHNSDDPCAVLAARALLTRIETDGLAAPQQPARDTADGDGTCECGCQPGQTCTCSVHDCDCIGGCPVCDADETEHAPGGEAL